MRTRLNGYDFQLMVQSALNNIRIAEQRVNSMNVFPVADGDTGTNMRLTLENGFVKANKNRHSGCYFAELAAGMLLGARGNSGVILSQLFKGMSLFLEKKGIVNPGELREALILGYKTAYSAVINPVEGTILTVTREGIENIKSKIRGRISFEDTFKLYLNSMYASLQNTPNLLGVLKEANVVDSGAYGYILIIEGMYKYLIGDPVEVKDDLPQPIVPIQNSPIYFNEKSDFIEGYCMEFLLQLLSSRGDVRDFSINKLIDELKPLGTSIVSLKEGTIVKVHIHTLNPAPIIDVAQQYGEFVSFKLENMQVQHNEFSVVKNKDKDPSKELGIIAIVNGKEIQDNYRDFGCDYVIEANDNMNSSSSEILDAIESINAKKIVIFPNNVNTIGAANQAIGIARAKDRVFIVPSKTMMEGLVSLQMDMPDAPSNERITEFNRNINNVITIGITSASKNYEKDGFCCKINDKIAVINDQLVACSDDVISCLDKALKSIDLTDKNGMFVYLGESASEDLEDLLNDLLADLDGIDYQVTKGGQSIYDVLIGIF